MTDEKPGILALIVEDDSFNSNLLKDLLQDHFPQVRVAGIAASVAEASTLIRCLEFDLIFLDIELPDGNGFDLLADLPEVKFGVIVTTSFSKYAIDAIHFSALDYLMKPVNIHDLTQAMGRFFRKFEDSRQVPQHHGPGVHSQFHRLPLPTAKGFIFVSMDEIIHVSADGSYTGFTLQNGRKIIVSRPLHEFEDRLLARNFFRVHHSHIINLAQVATYFRGEGGHVVMSDNSSVPVSRNRKEEFLRTIGF
jgi:two-component system LytT family response regulator